jgi:hypothetical protein
MEAGYVYFYLLISPALKSVMNYCRIAFCRPISAFYTKWTVLATNYYSSSNSYSEIST